MHSRRVVPILSALLLVGTLIGASACDTQNLARYQDHVLNRIGYGPDAWSRARIQELGVIGYIEEQLTPSALDDSALEAEIASLYPVTTMPFGTSRMTFHEYTGNPETGPFVPMRDATRAKILRSVASKKQLEQVLVDFWYNHFNVEAVFGEARWGFLPMERDAIRPYVFGRFEDMLRRVAQSPGMLDYLDNALNFKDGFVHLNIPRGINENYAREILELHTLGVDGGYTQEDVREVARAFTGWTIATNFFFYPNGYLFLSQGHDRDPKSLFGGALQLPGNRGQADGLDVIAYLAAHPKTAERISRKLCQRFIHETNPPQEVVQAATDAYLSTGGDLSAVLRAIFYSREFLRFDTAGSKVKRPLHYVASMARRLGVADRAAFAAAMDGTLQQLGEGLYRAGPPTGYPESSRFWSGEGAYVQRARLAWRASNGEQGFQALAPAADTTPEAVVNAAVARIVRTGIEPSTRQALVDLAASLPPAERAKAVTATLLASPDFMVH